MSEAVAKGSKNTVRPTPPDDPHPMDRLVHLMRILRSDQGCPWDREQTLSSLKENLVEETYEVIDAIDSGDMKNLKEELGDLLLQVVFQAQLCDESGDFDFNDVAAQEADKLVHRHPHVFGDAKATSPEEALKNWEGRKNEDIADTRNSVLDGIPSGLPALNLAFKIQKKAARVGFDWPSTDGVLNKLEEETNETRAALRSGEEENIRDELGDLLFVVINLCRKAGCHPDDLLRQTNAKFQKRFRGMEKHLGQQGKALADCGLEEMESVWEGAKGTK